MSLVADLCLLLWPPLTHGRVPIPRSYVDRAELAAPLIAAAVDLEGGDPFLLGALLVNESGLIPHARGLRGELGYGQIHPGGTAAAACSDLDWRRVPADNVRCAARHLDRARAICRSVEAAISYYNGRGCNKVTSYSRRVMALLAKVRKR